METTIRKETARPILRVPGRAGAVIQWPGNGSAKAPYTVANQRWVSERRKVPGSPDGEFIRATLRFDDNCKNGHMSFAITGEIHGPRGWVASGCVHVEIAAAFPELAPLIKWHLCATDGPLHYLANTLYLAGDADHNRRRPGDVSRHAFGVRFGGVPIVHKLEREFWEWLQEIGPASAYDFQVLDLSEHKDGHIYRGYAFDGDPRATSWHRCPFKAEQDAFDFLAALKHHDPEFIKVPVEFSEGKARDLGGARRAAVWPDATDADLLKPRADLEAALKARLPGLLADFRRAMVSDCGFVWEFDAAGEVQ